MKGPRWGVWLADRAELARDWSHRPRPIWSYSRENADWWAWDCSRRGYGECTVVDVDVQAEELRIARQLAKVQR